jgi:hypothetical protein
MLASVPSIIVLDASYGDFSCFPTPPGSPHEGQVEQNTCTEVAAKESSSNAQSADAQSTLPVAVVCEEVGAEAGAATEPCVGTSGPVADSTETTDNTSAAPSSSLEPPLKKRRAGELLQLQRAAQFKTCADALGTLGLQKVHTNNGGVNACLMYSFLLSSGKMHPKQQKIGCASHNLAPTWNVKLVCSQDRVLSRDAFYRANELRLEAYEILLASLPEHPTDVDPQHWSYGMSKERVCACHYDIRCACCACCKLSHVLTCLRCRQNGSMKRNAS